MGGHPYPYWNGVEDHNIPYHYNFHVEEQEDDDDHEEPWYKVSPKSYPYVHHQKNPYQSTRRREIPVQNSNYYNGLQSQKSLEIKYKKDIAALKIQSAFRAYHYVRKFKPIPKLRIIRQIEKKATDIRRRIRDSEFVDLIRNNEKEKIRVGEELMSLILQLDEVQKVNDFLREVRKGVVRKVVALQDTVDKIIKDVDVDTDSSLDNSSTESQSNDDIPQHHTSKNSDGKGHLVFCNGNREMDIDKSPSDSSTEMENSEMNLEDEADRDGISLKRVKEQNEKLIEIVDILLQKNKAQEDLISQLTSRILKLEDDVAAFGMRKTMNGKVGRGSSSEDDGSYTDGDNILSEEELKRITLQNGRSHYPSHFE